MARKIWSVTGLISHLSDLVEQNDQLRSFWIEGEISNFTHHNSGHMYFTLKDKQTKIKVVMFSRYNRLLLFKPKNGDHVRVRGELYVYEREGQIQVKAWEMKNSGVGDLHSAYLRLKEKLEEEGLFATKKQEIPRFPKRVGVVTSARGAAIRDIITTIMRRYPETKLYLFPVSVQGYVAPDEIAFAIDKMNEMKASDVLIVGRGGGSLEELWAFNEEKVVRSIAASKIPIISAVGHETDTTLSDFAADLRAATPTAAAEMVVPDKKELIDRLDFILHRLQKLTYTKIDQSHQRLGQLRDRPIFRQPRMQLGSHMQRLDYAVRDLEKNAQNQINIQSICLERVTHRLKIHRPEEQLKKWNERLKQFQKESQSHIRSKLEKDWAKFENLVTKLDALSPLKVMNRGYSLLYRLHPPHLIRSIKGVKLGDLVRVRLPDGELHCQVWKTEEHNHE